MCRAAEMRSGLLPLTDAPPPGDILGGSMPQSPGADKNRALAPPFPPRAALRGRNPLRKPRVVILRHWRIVAPRGILAVACDCRLPQRR